MLRREMRKIQSQPRGRARPARPAVGDASSIDPRREEITMREAARMNVPVVAILDTDCDPDLADIAIPANDDAMSSVQLILSQAGRLRSSMAPRTSTRRRAWPRSVRLRKTRVRARSPADASSRDRGPRRGRGGGAASSSPVVASAASRRGRFATRAGGHADCRHQHRRQRRGAAGQAGRECRRPRPAPQAVLRPRRLRQMADARRLPAPPPSTPPPSSSGPRDAPARRTLPRLRKTPE